MPQSTKTGGLTREQVDQKMRTYFGEFRLVIYATINFLIQDAATRSSAVQPEPRTFTEVLITEAQAIYCLTCSKVVDDNGKVPLHILKRLHNDSMRHTGDPCMYIALRPAPTPEPTAPDSKLRERDLITSAAEHLTELEDAWLRGAISEHDGHGGTRSNRNAEMLRKLRAYLSALAPAAPKEAKNGR